jgi:hypothetical protein
MGMNAATTMSTEASLNFGGTTIGPGKYTLTAKRAGENKWHLVFAGDGGNAEVPLTTHKAEDSVETFTIDLSSMGGNKGLFFMAWGDLKVGTEFTVK